MSIKYFTTAVAAFTILVSCNTNHENSTGDATYQETEIALAPKVNADIEPKKQEFDKKKIIKDGFIDIRSNDLYTSKKHIDSLIKSFNAYYESENLQKTEQMTSYNLKIRIPSTNFDRIVSSLEKGKDEIESKRIDARDVTEEFIDIEARLKSKLEYLNRYKTLLAKASTVKDIITLEENIRKLQEEIEAQEGRLKYLNDQVSFSTLNINLYQELEVVYKSQQKGKFLDRVKMSLRSGWLTILEFFLFIITVWPFILLILAGFGIRLAIKRNKHK